MRGGPISKGGGGGGGEKYWRLLDAHHNLVFVKDAYLSQHCGELYI